MRSTVAIALLCLLATSTSAASLVSSLNREAPAAHQAYTVTKIVTVALQSKLDGLYLQAFPSGAGPDSGKIRAHSALLNDESTSWDLCYLEGGIRVAFRSAYGTYLTVTGDQLNSVVSYSSDLGEDQTFALISENTKFFSLKTSRNNFIHVNPAGLSPYVDTILGTSHQTLFAFQVIS